MPQPAPEAVKAASRRLRGGLQPTLTAERAVAMSDHPFFLSEKMGFLKIKEKQGRREPLATGLRLVADPCSVGHSTTGQV